MKVYFWFPVIIIVALSGNLKAQNSCISGTLTLSTQAQINSFATDYPGCNTILGNLIIRGTNISSLGGLSQLTDIEGYLQIDNNPILSNLNGLQNLNAVGNWLDITNNTTLFNLSGLGGLDSCGSLSIYSNPSLTSLTGLNDLQLIDGDLIIYSNEDLDNLDGLDNLQAVHGSVNLIENDLLSDISGFQSLTEINGCLNVHWNPMLISLSGLENLETACCLNFFANHTLSNLDGLSGLATLTGDLKIEWNNSLQHLSGLSNLTSMDGILKINGNSLLTSLQGLENIGISGIDDLIITNNVLLVTCEVLAVCDYLDTDTNTATIYRNGAPCGDRTSVETACIALPLSSIEVDAKKLNNEIFVSFFTTSRFNWDMAIVQVSMDGITFSDLRFHRFASPNCYNMEEVMYTFPVDEIEELTGKYSFNGTIYFRIKSSYLDGSYGFSPMASVFLTGSENNKAASVFPNPVRGGETVRIQSQTGETFSVGILDLTGKTMLLQSNISNMDQISLDLVPAVYFVKLIYQAGNTELIRIIVQ